MHLANKLTSLLLAPSALVFLLSITAGAASVVPYGTYIVKGSFRGDYNTVLTDFEKAKLRVQRQDGTAIAETAIGAADAEGVNFVLSVPVASASTAKTCATGETLDAVFYADDWSLTVTNALTVGAPIHVGILAIHCTETKSYTNPKDGTVVEIPTSYIAEAQAYLDEEGGGTYDPWADSDGDGISNYGEYLAGTIPFDVSDRLRITEFQPGGERLALAFESVGGHVYVISSTDTLSQPEWAVRRVRKTDGGAQLDQVLAADADGEPGVTEIFITPVAGATGEFFRVEPK